MPEVQPRPVVREDGSIVSAEYVEAVREEARRAVAAMMSDPDAPDLVVLPGRDDDEER